MDTYAQKRADSAPVRHYYGDRVRFLFVAVAVISLIGMPLFGGILPISPLGQIGSALLLVALAGMTNPHSKALMVCNLLVAGAGALLIEAAAIAQSPLALSPLLIVQEINVLLLAIAFYYAVKSARAMFLGTIGKRGRAGEFE